MGPQSLIYFGIAGGSLFLAFSLLRKRYVNKDKEAMRSGGAFTAFAAFMILFAIGAALAGVVSLNAGR